jgi:hypothetical protein
LLSAADFVGDATVIKFPAAKASASAALLNFLYLAPVNPLICSSHSLLQK